MHYAHHGRHGFGNYRVSIWHFQVWASLTTLQIFDGWLHIENSRHVCQVRGSLEDWAASSADSSCPPPTSHMCQFSLPCSWLIPLFYTDSSCKPHLQTYMCQFSLPCYSLVLCRFFLSASYIHTCANFLHPVFFSCFIQILLVNLLRAYMCQLLCMLFFNLATSGGKQV